MSKIERVVRRLAVVAVGLFIAGVALAQDVRWQLAAPLAAGQEGQLELVFSDAQPSEGVELPDIDGLELLGPPSESRSFSMINFRTTSTFTLGYRVRPTREGRLQIPAFRVETSEGVQSVAALTLDVGEASVAGGSGQRTPIRDLVESYLRPSERNPYAGEVFDVELLVALAAGRRGELVGSPSWQHPGIVSEGWGEGERVRVGGGRAGMRFGARAMAPEAGKTELPPAVQEVQIETGRMVRSFPFSQPERVNVTVASDSVELDVQPLPSPAPAGFTGAIGNFRLESKIVPEQATAGEPVTWTLELAGTGNWPVGVELPPRAVPSDVRTIQPKSKREFAENQLFSGSLIEDLVLIPTQAGELRLDPVDFVYFNPDTGRYETASVTPPALAIGAPPTAGPTLTAPQSAPIARHAPVPAPMEAPAARLQAPEAPSLPRDVLAGASRGPAPWPAERIALLAALPLLLLGLYWFALAMRRARRHDPRRPQREALLQLGDAIERARSADDPARLADALLHWQKASAIVLGIDLAVPTAAQLRTLRAPESASPELRERWAALWTESDRAVWAEQGELASGWCERAAELRRSVRLPRWNPLRGFLPANLFPRAAALSLVLVATASASIARAEDPLAQYRSGEFAAAAEGFLARVAAEPGDWIARYNLGLTRSQQGEPARALAETTSAFLLEPREEAVRWNLARFADRMPRLDLALAPLVSPSLAPRLARQASPARWQATLVAASALFCLGVALSLRGRYAARPPGRALWLHRALIAGGATLALASVVALDQYGVLADRSVAMVADDTPLRSVPTDAETPQEQKALPAGSIVTQGREFLGWVRVVRPGGESGWMRRPQLVPLYEAPVESSGGGAAEGPVGGLHTAVDLDDLAGHPARSG